MLEESMTLCPTLQLCARPSPCPSGKHISYPHITGTSGHRAEGAECCAGGGGDDQERHAEEPDLEG